MAAQLNPNQTIPMNHRERVLTAINHERPNRCPMQVGFTPEFARRLRKELGLEGRKELNPHGGGNTYQFCCCASQPCKPV